MITSLKNNKIKHIRALMANRKIRHRDGEFFIEGVHAITSAQQYGWDIKRLVYCPDVVLTEWAQDIIEATDARVHLQVSEYVQSNLSERDAYSELMAVVAQKPDDLARVSIANDLLVLLLDRPRSPGNLGSAIRSADAMGAQAVVITGHAVDMYDPKTARASMGSLFALPVVRVQRHKTLEAWFAQIRAETGALQVVATSAHVENSLSRHDLTGPTVIIIGNEKLGLSQYFQDLCDAFVTIPMSPRCATSLNASVAASICLYEANRQRSEGGGAP